MSRKGEVVSAEGTWVSPDGDEPNPIQTTSIRRSQAFQALTEKIQSRRGR
ncbi:MAG TPA: hypothetical protein VGB35_07625 [Gammaproteobacteria bacterium]